MRQRWLAVPVLIACMGQAPAWAAEGKGQAPFDPRSAKLVCAAGRMTVWATSDLVEATKMHRAQSFTTRYWAQRVGGREAELAYELTYGRFVLEAVELNEDGRVTELLGSGAFEVYESRGRGMRDGQVPHEALNRLVVPLDEAMRVWTGNDWREVKYLK